MSKWSSVGRCINNVSSDSIVAFEDGGVNGFISSASDRSFIAGNVSMSCYNACWQLLTTSNHVMAVRIKEMMQLMQVPERDRLLSALGRSKPDVI
jgi:hypothetical protein